MSRRAVATTETVTVAIQAVRSAGNSVQYERNRGVLNITRVHQEVGGDFYRVRALALLLLEGEGARLTRRDRRSAVEDLARGGRHHDVDFSALASRVPFSDDPVRPAPCAPGVVEHLRRIGNYGYSAAGRDPTGEARHDGANVVQASNHLRPDSAIEPSGSQPARARPDLAEWMKKAEHRGF